MDDVEDYFNEGIDSFNQAPEGYATEPVVPAPSSRNFSPAVPRTGPLVTPLVLQGLSNLGEFDRAGICAVAALSRLGWLFFSKVQDGQTLGALGVLELYRSVWNWKRDILMPGFAGHSPEHVPGILPQAVWTTPMRQSFAYVFAAMANYSPITAGILATMPANMSELPAWFPRLRNSFTASAQSLLRAYVESPMPSSGDPIAYLARFVRDDLNQCMGTPRTEATPPPPQPATAASVQTEISRQNQNVSASVPIVPVKGPEGAGSSGGGGRPAAASSGGVNVFTILLLTIVGIGGYMAWQDSQKKAPALRGRDEDA